MLRLLVHLPAAVLAVILCSCQGSAYPLGRFAVCDVAFDPAGFVCLLNQPDPCVPVDGMAYEIHLDDALVLQISERIELVTGGQPV